MITELCEGGELFNHLRKSGRFPVPLAQHFAAEVRPFFARYVFFLPTVLLRSDCISSGLPAFFQDRLPRLKAGEYSSDWRFARQALRLWICQGRDGQDVDVLRHDGIHGARDHSRYRARLLVRLVVLWRPPLRNARRVQYYLLDPIIVPALMLPDDADIRLSTVLRCSLFTSSSARANIVSLLTLTRSPRVRLIPRFPFSPALSFGSFLAPGYH